MSSLDGTDPLEISLSAREIEIIELVAKGLTNQEIADHLTHQQTNSGQPCEQRVHQDRFEEPGGTSQLGHGQRQDLPGRLQLLRPSRTRSPLSLIVELTGSGKL